MKLTLTSQSVEGNSQVKELDTESKIESFWQRANGLVTLSIPSRKILDIAGSLTIVSESELGIVLKRTVQKGEHHFSGKASTLTVLDEGQFSKVFLLMDSASVTVSIR